MSDQSDAAWWRGATIYEVYPRSFSDSDDDGIGDLRGIVDRLGYIRDLGVDAVWLAPFFCSPQRDFGYDITDHCTVDPVYGDLDDAKRLVEKAHECGLRVIIDTVLNHTSDEHPWFLDSRRARNSDHAEWYDWMDPLPDGSAPNNWQSRLSGSQWTWSPQRGQYYRHQYSSFQPSLNLRCSAVVEAQRKVTAFWRGIGVDGFRFDAVSQYSHNGWREDNPPDLSPKDNYNSASFQEAQNSTAGPYTEEIVEAFTDAAQGEGAAFSFAEIDEPYGALDLHRRVIGESHFCAAYTPLPMGMTLDAMDVAATIEKVARETDPTRFVWCLTNHDAKRLVGRTKCGSAEDRRRISALASALLCALPGTVSFFQGEELGLPDALYEEDEIKDIQGKVFWPCERGRDGIRHVIPWTSDAHGGFSAAAPWLPIKDNVVADPVSAQEEDDDSPLAHWRRHIALRKNEPVLRLGSSEKVLVCCDGRVLHLVRFLNGDCIECVLNFSDEHVSYGPPDGEVLSARGIDDGLEPFGWAIVRCAG